MDSYEFLKAQGDEIIQRRVEKVAEMIYDWIHEAQVTHRKPWADRNEKDRAGYLELAKKICWRGVVKGAPMTQPTDDDGFNEYLPLRIVRIMAGEYNIQSANGHHLWYMTGSALAEWICARINERDELTRIATAQTRQDCIFATCHLCAKDYTPAKHDGAWAHQIGGEWVVCKAGGIWELIDLEGEGEHDRR